jgi:hypothetical protein
VVYTSQTKNVLGTSAAKAPVFDERFSEALAAELDLKEQWTFWEHYENL